MYPVSSVGRALDFYVKVIKWSGVRVPHRVFNFFAYSCIFASFFYFYAACV